MNRRLRRLNARREHYIQQGVSAYKDHALRTHWLNRALDVTSLMSWLSDDHRARAARFCRSTHYLANPLATQNILDNHSIERADDTIWVDGTPDTHNESLQNWRKFYVQPPYLTAAPELVAFATTQTVPIDLVQRLLKDNLTFAR